MAMVVLFRVFYLDWTIPAVKKNKQLAIEPALDYGLRCLHKHLTARTL